MKAPAGTGPRAEYDDYKNSLLPGAQNIKERRRSASRRRAILRIRGHVLLRALSPPRLPTCRVASKVSPCPSGSKR